MTTNLLKVYEFLSETKTFFLSTVKDGKPKCRPLGSVLLFEGRVYFFIGESKDVYKQMQENPYVEICASKTHEFLRYYGKAVFSDDPRIKDAILEKVPFLKQIYSEESHRKLSYFYLADATAEFRDIFSIKEGFKFE